MWWCWSDHCSAHLLSRTWCWSDHCCTHFLSRTWCWSDHCCTHFLSRTGCWGDHYCTHFLSRMVVLSRALVVLKWDKVKASKRLMLNRSCSQASISSARLIFLCTMENFTGGFCACAAASRFWTNNKVTWFWTNNKVTWFWRWGMGIAQWLERRTRDWKVVGSNPCRSGGRIFFSRVDYLCWLLLRYPFHPPCYRSST